jgi:hypothetical protein
MWGVVRVRHLCYNGKGFFSEELRFNLPMIDLISNFFPLFLFKIMAFVI